jgi:hypothetical protein
MLERAKTVRALDRSTTAIGWWLVESGDEVVGLISDGCKVARTGMAVFFFD